MSDIIQVLRNSSAKLLKAEGRDLAKWSKFKHNKKDFELFLQFNIAEVEFKTEDGKDDSIVCTSNTSLIKLLNTEKAEEKKKLVKFKGPAIRSKDPNSVLTWDLSDNSYKTICMKSWQIVNFISISPKNVLILDELVRKNLK